MFTLFSFPRTLASPGRTLVEDSSSIRVVYLYQVKLASQHPSPFCCCLLSRFFYPLEFQSISACYPDTFCVPGISNHHSTASVVLSFHSTYLFLDCLPDCPRMGLVFVFSQLLTCQLCSIVSVIADGIVPIKVRVRTWVGRLLSSVRATSAYVGDGMIVCWTAGSRTSSFLWIVPWVSQFVG